MGRREIKIMKKIIGRNGWRGEGEIMAYPEKHNRHVLLYGLTFALVLKTCVLVTLYFSLYVLTGEETFC
jgi:hypothetical protein